ncbi:hypothetical protein OAX78_03765 [Planctomycetota bacterium]|nr:hypothetical protein [Planctomycetota bacterium]
MAQVFELRLKSAALEQLRGARQKVRTHLGTTQVTESLIGLNPEQAGNLANDLLALLDSVDSVIARAKPAD